MLNTCVCVALSFQNSVLVYVPDKTVKYTMTSMCSTMCVCVWVDGWVVMRCVDTQHWMLACLCFLSFEPYHKP